MDTTPGSAQQSLEKSLPIAIKPLSGLGGGGGGGVVLPQRRSRVILRASCNSAGDSE